MRNEGGGPKPYRPDRKPTTEPAQDPKIRTITMAEKDAEWLRYGAHRAAELIGTEPTESNKPKEPIGFKAPETRSNSSDSEPES